MFRFSHFAATPALVLLMGGTAHAALTADQVWQSWKDTAAQAGLQVTAATESSADGVLTLNGISIAPEGETVAVTISDMTLTEEDDGSVTIAPGASIGADGGESGGFTLTHEGLEISVSEGEAGGMAYDYAADMVSVVAKNAAEGYSFDANTPAQMVTTDISVTFEALEGSYSDTPGENRVLGMELAAGVFSYDVASDDPNLKMKSVQSSSTTDIGIAGEFVMPATMELAAIAAPTDFGAALQDGLAVSFAMTQGPSTGTAKAEDEFFPYEMTLSSGGGEAEFSLDADVFSMTSKGNSLEIDMTTSMMPGPAKVTSGPIEMTVVSPVMATETAGDYVLNMTLSQFTLSDEVWGMFDPAGALKREPFDLAVDISGKSTMDLIGIMVADETGATPPIPAVETLDIKTLALKVAGAAANATGAFTFDNSPGFPMPVGSADVSVTGANALIDGLISIGIITEDDAMGARMAMGMFMVPGAEPDSLTSKIEMKEGMQLIVNGQLLPL